MSYCLNPNCQKPENPNNNQFCQNCGNKLLLREHYLPIKKIGEGGFGRTFLAIDQDIPSQPYCVIKQFFPQDQGTKTVEKAVDLFRKEAVRLDNLGKNSKQIPQLFAYFEQNEQLYLIQEFIDGQNLAEELENLGAFDENKIIQLLKSLLTVLQFVHQNQVIHRDIKPENIIRRNADQELILVDFGASKLATFTTLNKTGTRIGDPRYIAPEQTVGKAVFASDIYSLGITCIHLLTNKSPFELYDITEDCWIWREYLTTSISDNLANILDKMLQRALKNRYQSIDEILQDLEITNNKTFPNQDNAEIFYQEGMKNAQKGNYEEAINNFTEAIKLNPNEAKYYKFRGLAHLRLDDQTIAINDFKKAEFLYSQAGNISESQEILKRIENLKTPVENTIIEPKRVKNFAYTSGKIIAIDLGTTNTVMSLWEDDKFTIIPNSEGDNITPTMVAFNNKGECLIGKNAQKQALANPENTFNSFMRFIGCKYDQVTEKIKQVTYKVLADQDDDIVFDCPAINAKLYPEDILIYFLCKLADDASEYLGEKVTQVLITVPVYWNYLQHQIIINVAKEVDLEVLRIIKQTTAGSLVYGYKKLINETVLFFNLGGGNCDISVQEIGDGVFEVLSHSSDTNLGGNDFNQKIVNWMIEEFKNNTGIDLKNFPVAKQRLLEAAEKAKIELSSRTETEINIPFIFNNINLDLTLTRNQFENLCSDLISIINNILEKAIKDCFYIERKYINTIVLLGGCTRMPLIQNILQSMFYQKPIKVFNQYDKIGNGLAIQAGVLGGNIKDVLLLDVTNFSLGVETLGGVMSKIIPRNTTIPTKKTETFSTAVDGQTNVEIHILQGEGEFTRDNISLGTFRIDGIIPAPKGLPQIEVTFDIDACDILNVSAKDKNTGQELIVTINR